ncbi:tetratricopeptide repeat protein [Naumannella sp. ID2617S]|nr:tetratricopeptide repeat protein [Naumannella sp. ID2617S]
MDDYTTYQWAVLDFAERNYRDAAARFAELLETEPGNRDAREYLARCHYHRAALGKAERELRVLLEQDPTDEYATLLLARNLERQNRAAEAAGVRRVLAALTGDDRHLAGHTVAA